LAARTKNEERERERKGIGLNTLQEEDMMEGRKGRPERRSASCLPRMRSLEGAHHQHKNQMQKTYSDEEEEGGDGNRSQKASDHQEWVPDPGREEEESDQSRMAWGHREWVPGLNREEEEEPRYSRSHQTPRPCPQE
jgi:hypothetical protein